MVSLRDYWDYIEKSHVIFERNLRGNSLKSVWRNFLWKSLWNSRRIPGAILSVFGEATGESCKANMRITLIIFKRKLFRKLNENENPTNLSVEISET